MKNYIPPEVVDEIVRRADILELIGNYVPLKKRGKHYVALCPFHSEDTPSFTVNPAKQVFYCFGCQKGGNSINFLMDIEGLSWLEAAESLAQKYGVEIPRKAYSREDEAKHKEKERIKEAHHLAAAFYADKLIGAGEHTKVRQYLKKRALSKEIIERFRLGYAPEDDWEALAKYLAARDFSPQLLEKAGLVNKSEKNNRYYDKFHGRLIFPIYDIKGQVVAFGGRILDEGQPKYLNSNQTAIYNKSEQLYALNVAAPRIRQADLAVVMEGYMDVLTAHQYGVDTAVAPLGTAFTPQQAALLKRCSANVLLAFDGDKAGVSASVRSIDILREQGFNVRVLPLPEGLDPDDFLRREGKKGWDELVIRAAGGALEYLLETALKNHPGQSVADKGLIVQELLQPIAKTKSQVERDSFINLLAERLGVAAVNIYGDLRKSGLPLNAPRQVAKPAPTQKGERAAVNPGISDLERQMLRLSLEDSDFLGRIKESFPEGAPFCEEGRQLLLLAEQSESAYDFNPASLLHRLDEENEGLRQFLLKLLQENPLDEISDEDQAGKERLLGEYIKARRICELTDRLTEIDLLLKDPGQECGMLLREKSGLFQELKSLKVRAGSWYSR